MVNDAGSVMVGCTGSRSGMSTAQEERFLERLHALGATHLHHGDCVGSDEQAHRMARSLGLYVVSHPPKASGLRAFCAVDEEREPREFLLRNRAIVLASQVLIATPSGPEYRRSGTWSTIRFARRLHRPHIIIDLDGTFITSCT